MIATASTADRLKQSMTMGVIALAYFGASVIGYVLSEHAGFASPVWLPSGIAIAALLVLGLRYWPGVAAGVASAALYGLLLRNNDAGIGAVALTSGVLMVTANNTLESVLGAWLIRRFVGQDVCFGTFRSAVTLLGIVMVVCLLAAVTGAAILPAVGLDPWHMYADTMFTWWVGDATGVVLLLPVILSSCTLEFTRDNILRIVEFGILGIMLGVAVGMIFAGWVVGGNVHILPYIVIPILMWAVVRLGLRPAGMLLLFFSAFAAWFTMHGIGPFVRQSLTASILIADGFIITNAFTIILLASVICNLRSSEESLLQSEEQLHLTIESADIGTWNWHIPGGTMTVNATWAGMLGYEPDEIRFTYTVWERLIHADDFDHVMGQLQAHLDGDTPLYSVEYRIRRKDGDYIWTLGAGRVVQRDENGKPLRATGINMDISARKLAEQALQVNQFGIAQSSDGVFWINEEGRFLYGNHEGCRSLGYNLDQLMDTCLWEVDTTFDTETWAQHWETLKRQGNMKLERRYTRMDGSSFPVDISENYLEFEEDSYAFMFVRDSSERKQYEETLTYRLNFEGLIRSISTGFASAAEADIEPQVIRALDMLGQFEKVDYCYLFVLSEDQQAVVRVHAWSAPGLEPFSMSLPWHFRTEHSWFGELLERGTGFAVSSVEDLPARAVTERDYMHTFGIQSVVAVPVSMHGSVVGVLGLRTVTKQRVWSGDTYNLLCIVADTFGGALMRRRVQNEKNQLQAQLLQSQKMESLGTLAGGVAHEINNPINIIMNYAELIRMKSDDTETIENFCGKIIGESERVATIVRNLLAFSRHDQEAQTPTPVGEIIERTLSLMRTVLHKDGITLSVSVDKSIPTLACRPQHIQQVLMNLLTNARDALNAAYAQEDPGKQLAISVTRIGRNDQPWVRITVSDTGGGIAPEIQERIFEPFFTTKPRDEGTGLGLSVSHGIVREHGGDLMVESAPGSGTKFHIDLPLGYNGDDSIG